MNIKTALDFYKSKLDAFTLDPKTCELAVIESGYLVGGIIPGTDQTGQTDKEFLDSLTHLDALGIRYFVGYWQGALDAVVVVPYPSTARGLGRAWGQKAIGKYANGEYVKTIGL